MFRSIVLLVGGLASLSTVSLFAQDAVLGQEYGSGVHAYFSGDSQKAYDRLTTAIERGSKDPRAFYFRGLAYLKLGRPEEAKEDFRKGAELESKDINRFYNVGKALERVQGPERLELENYRVDARMIALEEVEKLRKERYEAIKREEDRVLREQAVAAPSKPIEADDATKAAENASPDPFAVPEATAPKNPGKAAQNPGKAPQAGGDPFADQPAKSAKTPPKKGGLLGAIGKAAESAATGKKSAPGKKPDAEKKPADDVDPFGGAPDDAKKSAAKKPAKPAEKKPEPADPFAP